MISRHQIKVFVSSATIAAALVGSFILGSANAAEPNMTVVGDNITIEGNLDRSQNKFYIGSILQGNGNGLTARTNANASVDAIPAGETRTNEPVVDDVLGDGSDPDQPVSTVLQALTGKMLTGLNEIPFDPAYSWAREYGLTTVSPADARMDAPILRYEFAKIMMNYIRNVENKTLASNEQCNIRKYSDYNSMNADTRAIVQNACDTGLMGRRSQVGLNQTITTLLPKFRAYDVLSTTELNIVLNRYVPSTVRLFPTNNTRSAVIRFLYTIAPEQ